MRTLSALGRSPCSTSAASPFGPADRLDVDDWTLDALGVLEATGTERVVALGISGGLSPRSGWRPAIPSGSALWCCSTARHGIRRPTITPSATTPRSLMHMRSGSKRDGVAASSSNRRRRALRTTPTCAPTGRATNDFPRVRVPRCAFFTPRIRPTCATCFPRFSANPGGARRTRPARPARPGPVRGRSSRRRGVHLIRLRHHLICVSDVLGQLAGAMTTFSSVAPPRERP